MFDLSLAEMAFTAVVALIIIGPKELPLLLKTLGRWIGKFKQFSRGVMAQLELDELQSDVTIIRNEAGEAFEAYDVSALEDMRRKPPSKQERSDG